MRARPQILLIAGAAAWLSFAGFDLLHTLGEVGATEKNGSGCVCHGFAPSAAVSVWIEGPGSVHAGSSAAYVLLMAGGPAAAGGYNLAAAHGTLAAGDTTSQLLDPGTGQTPELTHAFPAAFSGDTVRWAFTYHAPADTGADTLFCVGNSCDLNGIPTGDAWNFGAPTVIEVVPDTAVGVADEGWPATPALLRCYPNPFNPRTRLVFSLQAAGRVRLELFTIRGERVASLADGRYAAGEHAVEWDGAGAASGVYLARLQTEAGAATQKILLLR